MRVAIISDVFPPKSGGSGWSSFYLARALQDNGHNVQVVLPKEGGVAGSVTEREYEGLPVTEYHYTASKVPFVRNYTRNERLYPRMADWLTDFFRRHQIEVAHGQHYLTIPPTVQAAKRIGAVSVATVRDYWPVCYWTTHLAGDKVCPGCSEINRLKCLVANQGAAGVAAAPLSLYMGRNLQLKQNWLAQADKVLAVSHYVAGKLEKFVPRLEVVPNFIDVASLQNIGKSSFPEAATPYLLYAGKLEANKGARQLLDVLRHVRPALPTLIAGEGPLQAEMEQIAQAENLDLRFLGWVAHDEVLKLMAGAEALLYPSLWPEPLTRVLLEATAVGTLVVALNTGGTGDIIQNGVNGYLAANLDEMADHLRRALDPINAVTNSRLRVAAHASCETTFNQPVILAHVEKIYRELRMKDE